MPRCCAILSAPGLSVVIDPIDGTWNYANGLAVFGVLLSVLNGGETIFGLLYDPLLDDWVLARKGGGTWFCRDGEASRRLWLGDATRAGRTGPDGPGIVPLHMFPADRRAAVASSMASAERTMWLRCSCHEYRLLVLGALDHVISLDPRPWDHTAGVLAVQEAGGAARCADGSAYLPTTTKGMIVAAATEARVADLCARYGR